MAAIGINSATTYDIHETTAKEKIVSYIDLLFVYVAFMSGKMFFNTA